MHEYITNFNYPLRLCIFVVDTLLSCSSRQYNLHFCWEIVCFVQHHNVFHKCSWHVSDLDPLVALVHHQFHSSLAVLYLSLFTAGYIDFWCKFFYIIRHHYLFPNIHDLTHVLDLYDIVCNGHITNLTRHFTLYIIVCVTKVMAYIVSQFLKAVYKVVFLELFIIS